MCGNLLVFSTKECNTKFERFVWVSPERLKILPSNNFIIGRWQTYFHYTTIQEGISCIKAKIKDHQILRKLSWGKFGRKGQWGLDRLSFPYEQLHQVRSKLLTRYNVEKEVYPVVCGVHFVSKIIITILDITILAIIILALLTVLNEAALWGLMML